LCLGARCEGPAGLDWISMMGTGAFSGEAVRLADGVACWSTDEPSFAAEVLDALDLGAPGEDPSWCGVSMVLWLRIDGY
jgi:hypothetical protein